ncbi:MAG: DUF29 domain-containing protein [Rhodospirillales bacterium]|nr:DUF29 domain-containing protein [Rhodospirillales bacterium]
MAIAEKRSSAARWICELHSSETLADDLGVLGTWVGPRTGPIKRTKGQKEDYVLRRLLVAWKMQYELRFPVEIEARTDEEGEPDFVFIWPDGQTLGLEVTEAGDEDYQKWLTETEDLREEDSQEELVTELPQEASTPRTVSEIKKSIGKKVKKFDRGDYRSPLACDLIVYDNTAWGGFLDQQQLLQKLGRPNDLIGRFRKVHIVFGDTVILDIFGSGPVRVDLSDQYEIDYARWIFDQIERLRRGATQELDLAHIAEELEDLGKSERRALASHLKVLMEHLLKWQLQPLTRSSGWRGSIENARTEIHELLTESPSLRAHLRNSVSREYGRSRLAAARESDLPFEVFPEECPYTLEQLIDPEFLPGGEGSGAGDDQ